MKDYEIKLQESREKIIKCAGKAIPETSGIYIFYREEDGIRYAYVGQARHLLTRLAQHLNGYEQHIDLSIRKHGLYEPYVNPTGWQVCVARCKEDELDEKERFWIRHMARKGYQLRNKTVGGQDSDKYGIAPNKPAKTYRDGVSQGYENARREVAKLFKTYLKAEINGTQGVRAQNALQKFEDFIKGADNG